ncbi:hypothetical protein SDC9_113079 [bioreactor metagenome]|uniref:Uncharacterized protein n=1 Tax=bioreactor metagenome TaxID=1076179 RepID=A0A645BLW5_9ZZZZ
MHGHADQLFGHFHGNLVVTDEEELRSLRHAGHQLGIAFGIGVVQRRIHLVQQTERRGVELENRKHQGDGGQCLFAARQQVNRLVLLARWLCNHLHARVQNLVAGHHQLGLTAAEQLGEHAAEMAVHGLEGARQQGARFGVDLADRVLQRVHRHRQVFGLRI